MGWTYVSSEPHSRSKEWPVPRNLEHLVLEFRRNSFCWQNFVYYPPLTPSRA